MHRSIPLGDEERLFIEAIRGLNYQASRLRAEENSSLYPNASSASTESAGGSSDPLSSALPGDDPSTLTVASRLFPGMADPLTDDQTRSASDGLNAAADALAQVARHTYFNGIVPNLSSAISWINNVTRPPEPPAPPELATSAETIDSSGGTNVDSSDAAVQEDDRLQKRQRYGTL